MSRSAVVAAVLGSGGPAGLVAKGSYSPTPSDTADLPRPGVLFVLADGDVSFVGADGATDTWAGMKRGEGINVLVTRVRATGTTATVKVMVA